MMAQCTATPLIDDARTRVTRWDFAPGNTTGWHKHEMDYVIVILTDAKMAYEQNGEVIEREVKAGDTYARGMGIEHDVFNPGPGMLSFIEVELKD